VPLQPQHASALRAGGFIFEQGTAGLSKRLGSHYRSGCVDHWLKIKNPAAPAVKREAKKIGAASVGHASDGPDAGFAPLPAALVNRGKR